MTCCCSPVAPGATVLRVRPVCRHGPLGVRPQLSLKVEEAASAPGTPRTGETGERSPARAPRPPHHPTACKKPYKCVDFVVFLFKSLQCYPARSSKMATRKKSPLPMPNCPCCLWGRVPARQPSRKKGDPQPWFTLPPIQRVAQPWRVVAQQLHHLSGGCVCVCVCV